MRIDLGRVAGGIGASVLLYIGEQKPVVAGALGAFETTPGCGHKLGIALAEWSEFEDEHEPVLDPMLEVTNWEQDALGLIACDSHSSRKHSASAFSC